LRGEGVFGIANAMLALRQGSANSVPDTADSPLAINAHQPALQSS